ncbi:MAG: hypothetical protein ACR2RL_26005, partial [Gammaproteobacteria bacterium]
SHDLVGGRYEAEVEQGMADALARTHGKMRRYLLRPELEARAIGRVRAVLEQAVTQGEAIGEISMWFDLYMRQRCYVSSNFLACLSESEAILPFYTWDLLSLKHAADNRKFTFELYAEVFRRYYPQVADIPHASYRPDAKPAKPGVASATKRLARKHLIRAAANRLPGLFQNSTAAGAAMAAHLGARKFEAHILHLERGRLLEEQLQNRQIEFDWACL